MGYLPYQLVQILFHQQYPYLSQLLPIAAAGFRIRRASAADKPAVIPASLSGRNIPTQQIDG